MAPWPFISQTQPVLQMPRIILPRSVVLDIVGRHVKSTAAAYTPGTEAIGKRKAAAFWAIPVDLQENAVLLSQTYAKKRSQHHPCEVSWHIGFFDCYAAVYVVVFQPGCLGFLDFTFLVFYLQIPYMPCHLACKWSLLVICHEN